ncbi:MAG: PQQ-binding-like beta-propeller repeat protein [Kiritimatiellaceae bacterium]|nr:PQQ-binding-like beta-propeller repeat protein [Kiritimatiellaceae bacterium]
MKNWMLYLTVAAAAAGGYANDWPVWRGPDGNGISKETGWDSSGAKTLWTKELGAGYSSVSVKGDKLYTMGHESADDKAGKDTVYCLDAKTGKEVWSYSYASQTGGKYKGPRATPVIDGDCVYTVSQDGLVICLDAASGKIKWQADVPGKTGNKNIRWGISSSAVIEGNMILLNIGSAGVALDKNSGSIKWSSVGAPSYASPVVFDRADKRCAAMFTASGLQTVDAKTGKQIASIEWITKFDINGADPLVIGDKIFISSGYDRGCAMLDFSSGELNKLWESTALKTQFSSCVYIDGYIYGIDGQTKSKGTLRCISAADGSEKWSEQIGFGSLIAADGKLIVLGESGTLYFAATAPDKYNEISKMDTGLGQLCWTPPVLANGIIYCRNDKGTLVAINVSK